MPDVSLNGIEFKIKGSANEASASVQNLINKVNELRSSMNGLKSVQTTANAIKSVGNAAKKANTPLKNFVSSLKRIAFYRILRSILKSISQAFQEGLKNAYQFSKATGDGAGLAAALDNLATKSLTMKNQLGAAFGGLLTAITPIVIQIINLVTKLAEAITRLMAILGGGGQYLRAKEFWTDWGEAAEGAGGAAKKALEYLAPFDELNVLPDPKSGGGGGSADNWGDMFEYVDVEEGLGFGDILTNVFDKISEFFQTHDWQQIGADLWEKIKEAFSDTGKATEVVQSFFEALGSALGAATGLIIGFAEGIAESIAQYTKEQIRDYDGDNKIGITDVLTGLWNSAISPIVWIDENIVKPFIRGFKEALGLQNTEPITVSDFIGWLPTNQDWINWFHSVMEWIDDGVQWLSEEITALFFGTDLDTFNQMSDEWAENAQLVVEGFLQGIADGFSDAVQWVKDNIFDPIVNAIKSVFGIHSPAENMKPLGKQIVEGIKSGMKSNWTSGLSNWLITNIYNPLASKWNALVGDDSKWALPIKGEVNDVGMGSTVHISGSGRLHGGSNGSFSLDLDGVIKSGLDKIPKADKSISTNARFTAYSKDFKSGYQTTPSGSPLFNSQAMFTSYGKNFKSGNQTTSSGSPQFNSQAMFNSLKMDKTKFDPTFASKANFTSRKLGDKFSTVFASTANINSKWIAPDIRDSNGNLIVATKVNIVGQTGTPTIRANIQPTGYTPVSFASGGAYRNGAWHGIPQYASGGSPHGSLFIAGESGAELVGHIGGSTEVLNQSQIASAIASGVARYLNAGSDGGNEDALYRAFRKALDETDFGGDIELDGEKLYRAMVNRNREMKRAYGVNLMAT